jgi:hypothetical protein
VFMPGSFDLRLCGRRREFQHGVVIRGPFVSHPYPCSRDEV